MTLLMNCLSVQTAYHRLPFVRSSYRAVILINRKVLHGRRGRTPAICCERADRQDRSPSDPQVLSRVRKLADALLQRRAWRPPPGTWPRVLPPTLRRAAAAQPHPQARRPEPPQGSRAVLYGFAGRPETSEARPVPV